MVSSQLTENGWYRKEGETGTFCWHETSCASQEAAARMKTHAVQIQNALLNVQPSGIRMQYAAFQDTLMAAFMEKEWVPVTPKILAERLTCPEMDLFFAQLFEAIGQLRQLRVRACVLSFSHLFMRKGENGWEASLADLSDAWFQEKAPEVLPASNAYTRKDIAKWLEDPKEGMPPEGGELYALAAMFQEALKLARKEDAGSRRLPAVDHLHAEFFSRLKARHSQLPTPQQAAEFLKQCAASCGCMIRVRIMSPSGDIPVMPSIQLSAEAGELQLSYARQKKAQRTAFTQFEDTWPFLNYTLSVYGSGAAAVNVGFPRMGAHLALECTLEMVQDETLSLRSERLVSLSDPGWEEWIVRDPGNTNIGQAQAANKQPVLPSHPAGDPEPAPSAQTGKRQAPVSASQMVPPVPKPAGEAERKPLPPVRRAVEEPKTEVLRVLEPERPVNYIVRIEWLPRDRLRLTMVNQRSFVIHALDAELYGLEAIIRATRS